MRRLRFAPTPLVLGALILLVAAAGTVFAARQDDPSATIVVLLATVIGCGALAVGPWIHPGIPIALGVLLSVFSGNWDNMGVPIGIDRPVLAYGVLLGLLRTLPDARERWTLRLSPVHGLLVVVAAYGIASALSAGTLGEAEPTFALSERLGITGFFLFLVAPRAFRSERARDALLAGFLVLGGYLGLMALFQGVGLDQLVFPRYITDPSVGIHPERARGPFVEAGQFGLALFASAVFAAIALTRWRRPAVRAAAVAVIVLCALGVVLTLTRQAWLAAVAGTLVAMALTPALRRLLIPTVVAGTILVAVAFSTVPGLRASVTDRAETNLSVYDRLNSNRAAFAMAKDEPLFGFGWYTFADASLDFLQQTPDYQLRSVPIPHNVFLGFAAELGFLGLGLWLLALVIVIGTAIIGRAPPAFEPWRVGTIAIVVAWFVVSNLAPGGSAFANEMVWLLPAIVWAGLGPHPVLDRVRELRRRRGRAFAPLATGPRIGLALLFALIGGAVGLAVGQLRSPTYLASTQLSVGGPRERSYDYPFLEVGFERWASTYGRLGLSDSVIGPAAREVGTSTEDLRERTVVTPVLEQPVVAVRVRAASHELAQRSATAVATALTDAIRRVVRQEPAQRGLLARYEQANDDEQEAIARAEREAARLGEQGVPFGELPSAALEPLNRAQAEALSAVLRRVGIGARYVALATTDRGSLELQPFRAATVDEGDRWSIAGLWCCAGLLVGLMLGASAGLFPPRRRARAGRARRRAPAG